MKQRLLYLVPILLVLISIAGNLFIPSTALAASTPEYAFNFSNSPKTLTAMTTAAGQSCGITLGYPNPNVDCRTDDPAFQSSNVIARGGFFGKGVVFNYASFVNGSGYQYIHDYYCANGHPQASQPSDTVDSYKIEVSIIMDLQGNFFKAPSENYLAHVTHVDFTGKQIPGTPINSGTGYPLSGSGGVSTADYAFASPQMPSQCVINNFNVSDDTNYITSPGVVVLSKQYTPQSVQDSWATTIKDINAGSIGSPNTPGGGSGGGSASPPKLSCSIGVTGLLNPLNWILCPAVNGMADIIGFIDNAITSQLSVGSQGNSDVPNQIFCGTGNCVAYHRAWQSFRNIALGLMAVAGLIVLITQALGVELLDAYMIRKTLPRLLIAAIAISLSWQLMAFFVQLTNDLGYGVRALIYYPFTSTIGSNISINANSLASNGESLLAGIGAIAIGSFGILTLAAAGALALLIAFFVLVLRQIAIIVLIIMAPLAIFAYILPNTQNFYRLWWDSFSRALLMFPLIAAFIAAGHVFSLIAAQNSTALFQIAAFVAYFAPYFLIPATFSLAGNAIRQIGGAVNSRSSGAFGTLRQKRKENTGRRVQRARAGKLWKENWGSFGGRLGYSKHTDANGNVVQVPRSISRYANRAALWGLDPDEMVPAVIGTRGGRVGRALFGNYALNAQDQIDNETTNQIQKAAQYMAQNGPLHHKAEKAIAGTWAEGEGQFSPEVLKRVKASRQDGGLGFIPGQSPVDTNQMMAMAEIMKHGTTDEVSAAEDLETAAGFLGNINKNPEMYRASGNMQAVGGLMLAMSGRLDPDGKATILNNLRTHPRQGKGLATRFDKMSSNASHARSEMQFGKDVYQTRDGVYHSTFAGDADEWTDPNKWKDEGVQWDKAKDDVLTQKMQNIYAAKGETVLNNQKVWRALLKNGPAETDASGKPRWSNEQETARQQIFGWASQYSSTDADAKTKVLNFLDDFSRDTNVDLRSEFDQREARHTWDPRDRHDGPEPDVNANQDTLF